MELGTSIVVVAVFVAAIVSLLVTGSWENDQYM